MWRKLLEEKSVDWGDIFNKPNEYPPELHLHIEYAGSVFLHKGVTYDTHDVISQIVVFLEDNYAFKLK